MLNRIGVVFTMVAVFYLTSCDKSRQLQELAKVTLQQTTDNSEHLKIISISEPDSAFGTSYFSHHEVSGMINMMNKVSDSILKRTNNMTEFHPDDYYVIGMAERQMRATSDIRSILNNSNKKGSWSGWKVRIDYQCQDNHGCDYRAKRWYFIDKEGNHIIKTIEIPLP